jgi:hypothetical protein
MRLYKVLKFNEKDLTVYRNIFVDVLIYQLLKWLRALQMFLIFCHQNQLVIVVGLRLTATCAAGSSRIQIKVVARLEFHFGGGGRKKRAEPNKSSSSHCEFRLVRAAILQDEQKGR